MRNRIVLLLVCVSVVLGGCGGPGVQIDDTVLDCPEWECAPCPDRPQYLPNPECPPCAKVKDICDKVFSVGFSSIVILTQEALQEFDDLVTDSHAVLLILPPNYQGNPEEIRQLIVDTIREDDAYMQD